MYRDYQKFPDDDNGNILWQMYQDGDDLKELHDIEFSLSFIDHEQAEYAALHLLREQQKLNLIFDQHLQPHECRLTVFVELQPEYQAIVDMEEWLQKVAEQFKGEYDGWGCMAYVFDDQIDGTS